MAGEALDLGRWRALRLGRDAHRAGRGVSIEMKKRGGRRDSYFRNVSTFLQIHIHFASLVELLTLNLDPTIVDSVFYLVDER